jgi:hypothetical protein
MRIAALQRLTGPGRLVLSKRLDSTGLPPALKVVLPAFLRCDVASTGIAHHEDHGARPILH